MFYLTAEDATEQLLQRCEQLLNRLSNKRHNSNLSNPQAMTNGVESHQLYQNHKDNIKQQHNHHPSSHITSGNNNINALNGYSMAHQDQQQQQHMAQQNHHQHHSEDVSYLDMSAANNKKSKCRHQSPVTEFLHSLI